jgi:nitrate/TMAO reductase-like tetraheme cytochrome c subunit
VVATALVLAVGSGLFQFTELTESNEFCGETCHSVMHPEWIRYAESAHAKVNCVECHVGRDAEGYIRSKLSGLERVAAMVTGDITRPIPTPIHDLRPARELCAECHTPGRFVDSRQIERSYFVADEENTPVNLRMLINVGGRGRGDREGSGIHYHMFVAQKVEYIARDPQRQEIVWVKVTRADGSTVEYQDSDDPIDDEERASLQVRTMDCLDCHNRPAHRFTAPIDAVNDALASGTISREIPYIKLEAVKALDQDYASTEAAMAGIAGALTTAYQEEHPEFVDAGREQLPKAIDAVQGIYRETIFPEMKANWSAHPDNIGHRDWPGCFRCHNDELESSEGDTIFTTCTRCHLILSQGSDGEKLSVDLKNGKSFVHPEDDEEIEEYSACSDCHTGGAELYE